MIEISNIIERSKYLKRIIYLFCDIYFRILRKTFSAFPYKEGNLAVIVLKNIGDSVFSVPALKEITKNYPEAKITIVCFPESKPVFKMLFHDINFILIDKKEILFNGRFVKSSARNKIRTVKPSVIIDFTGMAFLIYSIRAREIIGMSKRQFKSAYDIFLPFRKKPHLIDSYLDVAGQKFRIIDSPDEKIFPVKINPGGIVLIHPLAGWRAKEWNMEKFIQLAQLISADHKVAFVVKEGNIKNEYPYDLISSKISMIKTRSIEELINVIKDSYMMISNDSGPLYLASFLGKPTFTIYGPTNPGYSVPFGKYHGYIRKQIKCSPGEGEQYCFTNAGRNGCPSFECMNLLTVDEVYQNLKKFIFEINNERISV